MVLTRMYGSERPGVRSRYVRLIIQIESTKTEIMPTSANRWPPKSCPVCLESIWSDKWNMPPRVWNKYKTHLQITHPAYERWIRRSGLAYLYSLVVFFGFAIAAAMQSSATNTSMLAILMFPATFAVILIVWMLNRNTTFKYHQSWVLEHGFPRNLGPSRI